MIKNANRLKFFAINIDWNEVHNVPGKSLQQILMYNEHDIWKRTFKFINDFSTYKTYLLCGHTHPRTQTETSVSIDYSTASEPS